jgi:hypothetical protein
MVQLLIQKCTIKYTILECVNLGGMKTLYSLIGAVRELAAEENTGLKRKMARHYKDALQQILLV